MFSRFTRFIKKQRTYLDYASQTSTDPQVLRVVAETAKKAFYNPGALYTNGVVAGKILSDARLSVARIFSGASKNSVHSDEIIFTGGGTESNNIAVQGIVEKWYENRHYEYFAKPHIIISEIEHPSLANIVEGLAKKNKITYSKIKTLENGLVDLKDLKEKLAENKNTILVSVMLVNNEIGTIQPIRDIASLVRKSKREDGYPLLHTDACQAINYLDMQLDKTGVDLMTLDASKFYGPKGIGALYVKRRTLLSPVFFGGDQEFGMRPGTENLPAIVGLAKALEIVNQNKEKEADRIYKLQQYIFKKVLKMKNISINGSIKKDERIVNNINICFKDKDSEFLLFKLDKFGFEVSTGTTCQNKKEDSRSVSVEALGGDCASSSLRISLGRYTTKGQVWGLVRALGKV